MRGRQRSFVTGMFCCLSAAAAVLGVASASKPASAADEIGRLFTTPQQRRQLDEARQELEAGAMLAPVRQEKPQQAEKKSGPQVGSITVRGLVTRSKGRSTAWVNDGNSYEGDLSNAYLDISPKDIDGQKLRMELEKDVPPVEVKVGETLEPLSGRVTDLVNSTARPVTGSADSTGNDQPPPRR